MLKSKSWYVLSRNGIDITSNRVSLLFVSGVRKIIVQRVFVNNFKVITLSLIKKSLRCDYLCQRDDTMISGSELCDGV